MMPDFDIVAIDCWHEVMFNRTHLGQDDHPLERSYHENMVNVSFLVYIKYSLAIFRCFIINIKMNQTIS